MKVQIRTFLLVLSASNSICLILEPVIEKVVHLQTSHPPPGVSGVWKKKLIWKSRWVQEWRSAKSWKPVWRKVWSPIEIREWVPVPKPPPSTDSTPLSPVEQPSWPSTDNQVLLNSYKTIHQPTETLILEPPKINAEKGNYQLENNTTIPEFKPVSPYATQLADAILKQKLTNITERPSGLTDIVFKPEKTTKRPGKYVTTNDNNLYIVTPFP